MEKNTTTLKNKSEIVLTDSQINWLYKEKNRADFDDRFAPLFLNSLKKSSLNYGYATNYEQTKMAFMTHGQNAIVVYDNEGNYSIF